MLKRGIDVVAALTALVVLAPVLAFVAVLVRLRLGPPVLFRQRRPGKDGRLFTLVKFRTMSDARDADGVLLPDGQRLPRFGRFLRSTSLDELPTLGNVVAGHMSLVGPRPLLPEYLGLYSARQARRHEVRPGMTGWAQVQGRNHLTWEERLEADVWYVENRSLALDVRILLRTVVAVLSRRGVAAPGAATMPRFQGTVER